MLRLENFSFQTIFSRLSFKAMRRLVINLFLCTTSVCAMAADDYSTEFAPCLNAAIESGGLINVQRIQCLKTELHTQELKLHTVYKVRFTKGSKHQRQLLKMVHHHWLSYRNSLCLYEKSFTNIAPHPDLKELFCRIDLTIELTQKLQLLTD